MAVLEINGTRDEAIPPRTVDAHRVVMEPAARKYRVLRVQDFQHYLFKQEAIQVVAPCGCASSTRVPSTEARQSAAAGK